MPLFGTVETLIGTTVGTAVPPANVTQSFIAENQTSTTPLLIQTGGPMRPAGEGDSVALATPTVVTTTTTDNGVTSLNTTGMIPVSFLNGLSSGSLASFLNTQSNTQNSLLGTQGSSTIEQVAAKLIPMDFSQDSSLAGSLMSGNTSGILSGLTSTSGGGVMDPIKKTGGLVFPYTPTITENVKINYNSYDLTHSNEQYYVYQSTSNPRISISDAVWTADTIENARYVLAVINFFRSHSLMDFGQNKTGRPPVPMWFTAYGSFMYNRVPVIMEGYDFRFSKDMDYVGIPDPQTGGGLVQSSGNPGSQQGYTWVPAQLEVGNIVLIVQRTPDYWLKSFDLAAFKAGTVKFGDSGASGGAGGAGALGNMLGSSLGALGSWLGGSGVGVGTSGILSGIGGTGEGTSGPVTTPSTPDRTTTTPATPSPPSTPTPQVLPPFRVE